MLTVLRDVIPRQVSFSLYWGMRDCVLSGLPNSVFEERVSQQSGQDPTAPLVLGIFFHELMSIVGACVNSNENQKEALAREFPKLIRYFSSKFPGIDLEYQPIISSIYKTISAHFDFAEFEGSDVILEGRITSTDSQLFGQPDLLVVDWQSVKLIDFKLTSNQERLGHDKNIAQLHFYAHLVEQKYGRLPSGAELVGLSGTTLPVPISRVRVDDLVSDAKRVLQLLREAVLQDTDCTILAKPISGVCTSCNLREFCPVSAA